MKLKRISKKLLFLLTTGILSSCVPNIEIKISSGEKDYDNRDLLYCPEKDTKRAVDEIELYIMRFDNYYNREPLDKDKMFSTRKELGALEVPECLEKAKSLSLSAMEKLQKGLAYCPETPTPETGENNLPTVELPEFLQEASGSQANICSKYYDDGLLLMKEAELELNRIRNCTPNCLP